MNCIYCGEWLAINCHGVGCPMNARTEQERRAKIAAWELGRMSAKIMKPDAGCLVFAGCPQAWILGLHSQVTE